MNTTDFVWTINNSGQVWTVGPQTPEAQVQVPGTALDISVGADATTWLIVRQQDGVSLQWYDAKARQWHPVGVSFIPQKVAGAPDGIAWVLSDRGEVWRVRPGIDAVLAAVPGSASQITAGADGAVWVLTLESQPGGTGNVIRRLDAATGGWLAIPFEADAAAARLAGAPDGMLWVIDEKGAVWVVGAQSSAVRLTGQSMAADITVGADGMVWIVGTAAQPGGDGNVIEWYDRAAGEWNPLPSPAAAVRVAANRDLSPPLPLPATSEDWELLPTGSVLPRWTGTDKYDPTKSTHLWIVCCAAEVARNHQPNGDAVYNFVKPDAERGTDTVHDRICEGLWDADEADPYRNSVLPGDTWYGKILATYKSHFYDPETGKNWLGETTPTALTEGCKFFQLALDQFWAGDRDLAAYNLGLSLHYLTDLTQPMHAANYTFLSSSPVGYHSAFEDLALQVMNDMQAPQAYVDNNLGTGPREYLIAAAKASRQRYDKVCSWWNLKAWSTPVVELLRPWQDDVKPEIQGALTDAVAITAQYLVQWMSLALGPAPQGPVLATLGQQGDIPVPGDYLGGGDVLPAIWRGVQPDPRPGDELKYVGLKALDSHDTWQVYYNTVDSVPVPAAYFTDAEAQPGLKYPLQPAIWRSTNGYWRLIGLDGKETYFSQLKAGSGAVPVPAWYGYGKHQFAQPAIWDPDSGTWYVRLRGFEDPIGSYVLGQRGDIPVPGDYTGDGKAQPAVWRPADGTWHIGRGTDDNGDFIGGAVLPWSWGAQGDIPVPGDYLGLGFSQLAVWRPGTGTWLVCPEPWSPSQSATPDPASAVSIQWGQTGDAPVPEQYDQLGYTRPAIWHPVDGTWRVIPGGEQLPATLTVRGFHALHTTTINGYYYIYTPSQRQVTTFRELGWADDGFVGTILADNSTITNAVPVYRLQAANEPQLRFELVFSDEMLDFKTKNGWQYIEMCGYLLPVDSAYQNRPDVVPVYSLWASGPDLERTFLVTDEKTYEYFVNNPQYGWDGVGEGKGKVGYMFTGSVYVPQLRLQQLA